jgi:hypothetical protein
MQDVHFLVLLCELKYSYQSLIAEVSKQVSHKQYRICAFRKQDFIPVMWMTKEQMEVTPRTPGVGPPGYAPKQWDRRLSEV